MKIITDLTILREYANDSIMYGLYWCKFNGNFKLFTRNGDTFKVLSHFSGHDELNEINNDVKIELLREKETAYRTKTTKQQALEREVEVLRTRNAELEADNYRLREALEHVAEYWNGNVNEKAMTDALDEIIETAEQALSQKAGDKVEGRLRKPATSGPPRLVKAKAEAVVEAAKEAYDFLEIRALAPDVTDKLEKALAELEGGAGSD